MKIYLSAGTCEIPDTGVFLSTIGGIASRYGITVQAIDADLIAGREHVIAAVKKAIRSMGRSENISGDRGLEILLHASGNRQIKKALLMGVRNGSNNVILVAVGGNIPAAVVDELENLVDSSDAADMILYGPGKRDSIVAFFGITEREIAAVGEAKIPKLVLERVALVDVLK
ncbi:MAG: KEOPS complex subunit Cgi121 [Euryarchaeota archaeon]|nr:KEOPS complex subunit Cgi121 [Euryarchaeota archaeon]